MRTVNTIFLLAFGIFIFCASSWIIDDLKTITWSKVKGEVIEMETGHQLGSSHEDAFQYVIQGKYQYKVKGQIYFGKFNIPIPLSASSIEIENKYINQKEIEIRYNPLNPAISQVISRNNYIYLGLFMVVCLILYFFILIVKYWLTDESTRTNKSQTYDHHSS